MGSCLDVDGSCESGILKRACVGGLCSARAGSGELVTQEGNLAVRRAVLTSYSAGLSAPWSQQLLTSLVMSIYPCFPVEGQGGRSDPFQPQDTEILLSPSALPYEFKT